MENPLRLIEPSESDVPVWTVSADGLESWLDAQTAPVADWVRRHRFEAKPGVHLTVPGDAGAAAGVVLGVSPTPLTCGIARGCPVGWGRDPIAWMLPPNAPPRRPWAGPWVVTNSSVTRRPGTPAMGPPTRFWRGRKAPTGLT